MSIGVTVVDFGVGNLLSVRHAFEHVGAQVDLASDPGRIRAAERLVLPGVGAFGDGMRGLAERGLAEAVAGFARSGRPLLGICLGMQMLLDWSEEFGRHAGLGLLSGGVSALPSIDAAGKRLKVPHVGWSPLLPVGNAAWEGTLLEGLEPGDAAYFVHSFAAVPDSAADRLADTAYGGLRICAVLERGNLSGCQFHPEKSGPKGLRIIRNFCRR
jgi:glutamine amidotransferase